MGQWTNSNIHRTVTDGPKGHANMSKCTIDHKKKNPYWRYGNVSDQGGISGNCLALKACQSHTIKYTVSKIIPQGHREGNNGPAVL